MKGVRGFVLFTALLFFSCKPQPEPSTLDIYVFGNVTAFGISPVLGADVFTVPGNHQAKTDSVGHARFKFSEPGSYELYGYKEGVGGSKILYEFVDGADQTLNMRLLTGVIPACVPKIERILPILPANFGIGDSIAFSFKVTDIGSDPEAIDLRIISNKDGMIATGHPSQDHLMNCTGILSQGEHILTVEATDERALGSSITFSISSTYPSAVQLDTAYKDGAYIQVKWLKYIGQSFANYTVYRTEDTTKVGVAIKTFTEVDSVCLTEIHPPIKTRVWYYVKVTNKIGMSRQSRFVKVDFPCGVIFNYKPSLAIHHPTLPILYVYDDNQMKLMALNHETNEIFATYNLTTRINDLAIDDNGYGMEVYVPSGDGSLLILDALTLVKKKTINVGIAQSSVTSNGSGFLFVIAGHGSWAPNPARTYSRSTGALIGQSKTYGLSGGERMRLIPGTHSLIAVATSGSPIIRDYVEFNYRGELVSENDQIWDDGYGLDGSNFKISPNGKFMVSSGNGAVYGTTSEVAYLGHLETRGHSLVDYAFSADGNTIYAGTWDQNSIQVLSYPAMKFTKEYVTNGIPRFVFPYNGNLITVSLQNDNYSCFIIEKVKIKP
jgi:hypothetical protein